MNSQEKNELRLQNQTEKKLKKRAKRNKKKKYKESSRRKIISRVIMILILFATIAGVVAPLLVYGF